MHTAARKQKRAQKCRGALKLKITARTILNKIPGIFTIAVMICGIVRISRNQTELFDRCLVVVPLLLIAMYMMAKVMMSDVSEIKKPDDERDDNLFKDPDKS